MLVVLMMIMVICVRFPLAYETVNFLRAVITSCPPVKQGYLAELDVDSQSNCPLAQSCGNGIESRELEQQFINIQHLTTVPKDHAAKEKLMPPVTQ